MKQLVIMVSDQDIDLLSHTLIWPRKHKDAEGEQAYELRWGRKRKLLHRIIMQRVLGRRFPSSIFVDHIDRNPLNNTRENLRLATARQNAANRTRRTRDSGKYTGVYKRGKKWQARASEPLGDGTYRRIHLGTFSTEEEAALAYNSWSIMVHGDYANLNAIGGS